MRFTVTNSGMSESTMKIFASKKWFFSLNFKNNFLFLYIIVWPILPIPQSCNSTLVTLLFPLKFSHEFSLFLILVVTSGKGPLGVLFPFIDNT